MKILIHHTAHQFSPPCAKAPLDFVSRMEEDADALIPDATKVQGTNSFVQRKFCIIILQTFLHWIWIVSFVYKCLTFY